MIEFDDVTFRRNGRPIISHMSFGINELERVAVIGGSGAGKTTILKLVMGLLHPDSGSIRIDGVDITEVSEKHMRDVRMKFSIVFQEGALFDSLSVKENVAFFLREYTHLDEQQLDNRVRKLLARVGVENAYGLMPEELSGGMQRRVAIARSLAVRDPKMFLYDEPTSDLDPISAGTIRRLIVDLADEGRGFIIVTHEMHDAFAIADRFMFIKGGKALFDGPREPFEKSDIPEIRKFIDESTVGASR
ncbi:MAG: ABC transporter ATP-binding protein [Chitinivibrionales bacterium]